jgi:uncharacterized cupredoxin-like copper-binding protein
MLAREYLSWGLSQRDSQEAAMRLRTILLVGALALMSLSSCGDNNGGGSEGEPQPAATAAETTRLDVTATEFSFAPEIISIPASAEVHVSLDNTGVVEHYWTVLAEPITTEAEFNDDLVLFEIEAHANDTAAKLLEGDLAPGIYQVICSVPGHFTAGMVGELVVTG